MDQGIPLLMADVVENVVVILSTSGNKALRKSLGNAHVLRMILAEPARKGGTKVYHF